MNYYLVQTKYFLIFIVIGSLSLSALPFLKQSFNEISHIQVQSDLARIQSEIFFLDDFSGSCYSGNVGTIIAELYKSSKGNAVCRTNPPQNSQIVVCGELEAGRVQCIDGQGVRCEFPYTPASGYSCKDLI